MVFTICLLALAPTGRKCLSSIHVERKKEYTVVIDDCGILGNLLDSVLFRGTRRIRPRGPPVAHKLMAAPSLVSPFHDTLVLCQHGSARRIMRVYKELSVVSPGVYFFFCFIFLAIG